MLYIYGQIKCIVQGFWRVTSETLHDILNLAINVQHFTILNYVLFCKCNGIPLGAHFILLNSGSILA